jgi:hypothetical protein
MSDLATRFNRDAIAYDGSQLRSHWILERFGLSGDAAVAFIGPCDVLAEHMIDVQDRVAAERIASERMLHFIIEHFDADLDRAMLRQLLFISRAGEILNRRLGAARIMRRGSDLYDGPFKVTVSVATVSPVSALIHAGVNVSSRGTPVPTAGLDDFGIPPEAFALEALAAYAEDIASARRARCKVRAARSG